MSTSLKSQLDPETVARNRRAKKTGGLGFLSSVDFLKRISPADQDTPTTRRDSRKEYNQRRIQKERQAMIEAGIIKPVVQ